jgi:hypothetical protein
MDMGNVTPKIGCSNRPKMCFTAELRCDSFQRNEANFQSLLASTHVEHLDIKTGQSDLHKEPSCFQGASALRGLQEQTGDWGSRGASACLAQNQLETCIKECVCILFTSFSCWIQQMKAAVFLAQLSRGQGEEGNQSKGERY